MRIATMTVLALALALSAGACKKKKTEGGTEGSGSSMAGSSMAGSGSSMAGSGSAAGSGSDTGSAAGSAAGSGSDTGSAAGSAAGAGSGSAAGDTAMAHRAGNCPSTVIGSTTKADVKGKDVVVTITATDKDAIATIQRRTEELLKEKADGGSGEAHDQKGTHGGATGICPVYWGEGGKATSKKEAKGVVVTITPKEKPDELKKTIDERIAKSADWVKANLKPGDDKNEGGVGGGKGEHGGNHSGSGDGKGKERKKGGDGGGAGTGGGGGKGTGGGSSDKKK